MPPVLVPVLAPAPPANPPNIPFPPVVAPCVGGADADVVAPPSPKLPNDRLGAEVVAAGAVPKRGADDVAEEVVSVLRLPKREGLLLEPPSTFDVSRFREKRLL